MKKLILAGAMIVPLTLTGCVVSVGDGDYGYDGESYSSWEDREYKNRKRISSLNLDMPIERVKDKMGVPDFNELYKRDSSNIQVLFYRTQRNKGDGVTTKDECTPLVFKDGVLVGWGENAYGAI